MNHWWRMIRSAVQKWSWMGMRLANELVEFLCVLNNQVMVTHHFKPVTFSNKVQSSYFKTSYNWVLWLKETIKKNIIISNDMSEISSKIVFYSETILYFNTVFKSSVLLAWQCHLQDGLIQHNSKFELINFLLFCSILNIPKPQV